MAEPAGIAHEDDALLPGEQTPRGEPWQWRLVFVLSAGAACALLSSLAQPHPMSLPGNLLDDRWAGRHGLLAPKEVETLYYTPPWAPTCTAGSDLARELQHVSWPLAREGERPPVLSKYWYINLGISKTRRQFAEHQLNNMNVSFERFEAATVEEVIRGERCPQILSNGVSTNEYPSVQGKWGVVACECSHYLLARKLAEHAHDLTSRGELWVVTEDDAILPPNLEDRFLAAWPYVPAEWDILRLGWFGNTNCALQFNEQWDIAEWSDPPPRGPCSYCGTQAYIVNPARVDRVLRRFESAKLFHSDAMLSAQPPPGEDPDDVSLLRAFAIRPPLATQDNLRFVSDIAQQDATVKMRPDWVAAQQAHSEDGAR